MADTLQFVESPTIGAAVRLDLNDNAKWFAREFTPNLPQLRRSMSQNLMRDGGYVASSVYDMRSLGLGLDLINPSEDTAAAEVQKLARELDRPSNWLKYQPFGATHPVWFKTYRSDVSGLLRMAAARSYQQLSTSVLADPFAQGARESIAVGTVANTAPFFDIPKASIKGDVAAPMVIVDASPSPLTTNSGSYRYNWQVAATTRSATSQPTVVQCESLTLGTDTAVSGSNARTTFTTTAMATRMTYTASGATARAMRGAYRVLCAVTFNSPTATAAFTLQVRYGSNATADLSNGVVYSESVDPTGTRRQLVDLGVVSFSAAESVDPSPRFEVQASVGTSLFSPTADFDFLVLVPVDESRAVAEFRSYSGGPSLGSALVLDREDDSVYSATSTAIYSTAASHYQTFARTGALPLLKPGYDNRFVYLRYTDLASSAPPVTMFNNAASGALTVYYTPLYWYVRPLGT